MMQSDKTMTEKDTFTMQAASLAELEQVEGGGGHAGGDLMTENYAKITLYDLLVR
jgi:hypothetical protein